MTTTIDELEQRVTKLEKESFYEYCKKMEENHIKFQMVYDKPIEWRYWWKFWDRGDKK